MKLLVVCKDGEDAEHVDAFMAGNVVGGQRVVHVKFMGAAMVGQSYDTIMVGYPANRNETQYIDNVLRPRLNPGGKLIFI